MNGWMVYGLIGLAFFALLIYSIDNQNARNMIEEDGPYVVAALIILASALWPVLVILIILAKDVDDEVDEGR